MRKFFLAFLLTAFLSSCEEEYDVLVVGGGASGSVCGIEAARQGARTVIAEPTLWLGGELTSAGVSAIDGNYRLRAGIFGEFTDSLAARYGGYEALKSGWVSNILFEPKVGAEILSNMASRCPSLDVLFETEFIGAKKTSSGWKVRLKGPDGVTVVRCRILVDGTELGDVAKFCGVPYELGYCNSGVVQDLTMVLNVKDYGRDASIPRPEGYDSLCYANCCVNPLNRPSDKGQALWSPEMMLSYGRLPNGSIMLNWPIEGNDFYAEMADATPAERDSLVALAKNHTLGYLYFIQNELGYHNIGIDYDAYPTSDGFPMIPYHRESRRIRGIVTFSEKDILDPYRNDLYQSGVAVGDYPIDHHHFQRSDWKTLPGAFGKIPSYTVPLGVMIPADEKNLIVTDKSISVTCIANGTTRLQPVLMELGQAAGILAAISARRGVSPAEVEAREVQTVLLCEGARIQPYLDSNPGDPDFLRHQWEGTTGRVRATGRNVGWSNEMWLYPKN